MTPEQTFWHISDIFPTQTSQRQRHFMGRQAYRWYSEQNGIVISETIYGLRGRVWVCDEQLSFTINASTQHGVGRFDTFSWGRQPSDGELVAFFLRIV